MSAPAANPLCNRPYRGTYAVRTAPCERVAEHDGFCRFPILTSAIREAVPVVALLLLLALALLADGAAAWGWAP